MEGLSGSACRLCPDMLPATMTGLHTRPVTPPTQTAASHGASCEAHFKKGEFNAFKLAAKFRSGIRINLMMWGKKTKKTLIINTPGLAGVSFSVFQRARVTY